jgi:hypothetical protein
VEAAAVTPEAELQKLKLELNQKFVGQRKAAMRDVADAFLGCVQSGPVQCELTRQGVVSDVCGLINVTGVNCGLDKELQTHKTVFAILGVNNGFHYGRIAIVLRPEILRLRPPPSPDAISHPDAFLVPNAATQFFSDMAYTRRPWCAALAESSAPPSFTAELEQSVRAAPLVLTRSRLGCRARTLSTSTIGRKYILSSRRIGTCFWRGRLCSAAPFDPPQINAQFEFASSGLRNDERLKKQDGMGADLFLQGNLAATIKSDAMVCFFWGGVVS